ncbi:hypothetical protein HDV03_002524 [Kappamyces sp. JEL0829]|nr:hypothetical protein HDV03_002524 [Kappamyces sp. JEL0829]
MNNSTIASLYDLKSQKFRERLGSRMNYGYWDDTVLDDNLELGRNDFSLTRSSLQTDEIRDILEDAKLASSIGGISGIDPVPSQVAKAQQLLQGEPKVQSIVLGDASLLQNWSEDSFDVLFSIDAAYHFDTRRSFLHQAHRLLQNAGALGLVDLCFDWSRLPIISKPLSWALAAYAGIPQQNQVSMAVLERHLDQAGFRTTHFQDISSRVFYGFYRWSRRVGRDLSWHDYLTGWLAVQMLASLLVCFAWLGIVKCVMVRAIKVPLSASMA